MTKLSAPGWFGVVFPVINLTSSCKCVAHVSESLLTRGMKKGSAENRKSHSSRKWYKRERRSSPAEGRPNSMRSWTEEEWMEQGDGDGRGVGQGKFLVQFNSIQVRGKR